MHRYYFITLHVYVVMLISLPSYCGRNDITISDKHTRWIQYMSMINSIEMHALVDVTVYTIAGKEVVGGST